MELLFVYLIFRLCYKSTYLYFTVEVYESNYVPTEHNKQLIYPIYTTQIAQAFR